MVEEHSKREIKTIETSYIYAIHGFDVTDEAGIMFLQEERRFHVMQKHCS